ncbi:MAG: 2-oxo acid dehydrogenase subunit E2, partial [Alphaproteobacteria bacterium]|nr:2-oxo acid dehydrogenase subunit E2 [Alphaproteobacteria bacterium]
IAEIEKVMIALSRRAVEGTLSVEEVSGGTFTVVNAGIYGSLLGTDLLTPPQVATLSVHKMHNRPVATDNGMEIRPMLYISLSYDHVIADTKQASEFVSCVKNYVENPGWKVLDL